MQLALVWFSTMWYETAANVLNDLHATSIEDNVSTVLQYIKLEKQQASEQPIYLKFSYCVCHHSDSSTTSIINATMSTAAMKLSWDIMKSLQHQQRQLLLFSEHNCSARNSQYIDGPLRLANDIRTVLSMDDRYTSAVLHEGHLNMWATSQAMLFMHAHSTHEINSTKGPLLFKPIAWQCITHITAPRVIV